MTAKDFLNKIKTFPLDSIKESVIEKIRKQYIGDPDFQPKRVQNASKAAK